jgi:hypothetical protein
MPTTNIVKTLRQYGLLATLYIAGPIFIITTDPRDLPLPLLVLPFMWLFTILFVTTWIVLKRRQNISKRQVVIISGVVASIPVLLAIFQSIHQLSIKDVLLSTGLVLLAAWYVLRADFIR